MMSLHNTKETSSGYKLLYELVLFFQYKEMEGIQVIPSGPTRFKLLYGSYGNRTSI